MTIDGGVAIPTSQGVSSPESTGRADASSARARPQDEFEQLVARLRAQLRHAWTSTLFDAFIETRVPRSSKRTRCKRLQAHFAFLQALDEIADPTAAALRDWLEAADRQELVDGGPHFGFMKARGLPLPDRKFLADLKARKRNSQWIERRHDVLTRRAPAAFEQAVVGQGLKAKTAWDALRGAEAFLCFLDGAQPTPDLEALFSRLHPVHAYGARKLMTFLRSSDGPEAEATPEPVPLDPGVASTPER